MLAAQFYQALHHWSGSLSWAAMRRPRLILQPLDPLLSIPGRPLVPGLAANPMSLAQLCHAVQTASEIFNKPNSAHLGVLAPRHSGTPMCYPNPPSERCHPCPRFVLLPMSPVHTCRRAPPSCPPPGRGVSGDGGG